MTAQGLIARAMRVLGALATGEDPTAAEAQDGLSALNAMISAWAKHRLTIPATTRTTQTLTVGTATYTIGPAVLAPNFIQTSPVYVSGIGILTADSPTIEAELDPYTDDQWRRQALKTQTGSPTHYVVQATVPPRVTFWPVPDAADTVAIYWPTAITAFANLTTDYTLGEGYEEALTFNLAVRLAPEFGRPLDPTVAALAAESLATIKRANVRELDMTVDPALLGSGGWSIYTGE